MKTRAAVIVHPAEPFQIEELTLDAPKAGEVLVRMAAVGVCHSDWHVVTGATKHPMPCVAGHEGAGVVEEVGEGVSDLSPGDHVVLNWAPACGRCFYCMRERRNLCETYLEPIWAGTMLDGTTRLRRSDGSAVYHYCGLAAHAERAVVARQSCVAIDKEVSLEAAALVGCAVATGVGAAMFTAKVQPGETVVVIGCGGVGLSIIQGARLCGAGLIIAIDPEPAKIWVAKHFGAQSVLMAGDEHERIVRHHTAGRGADHVFEAAGSTALQERALCLVRPGGIVTLAGLTPMGSATNLPGSIITRRELTVRGSYYGSVNPQRDFPMLIELYKAGKLNLDDLITRRYRLDQINDAYRDMVEGKLARGIITF